MLCSCDEGLGASHHCGTVFAYTHIAHHLDGSQIGAEGREGHHTYREPGNEKGTALVISLPDEGVEMSCVLPLARCKEELCACGLLCHLRLGQLRHGNGIAGDQRGAVRPRRSFMHCSAAGTLPMRGRIAE